MLAVAVAGKEAGYEVPEGVIDPEVVVDPDAVESGLTVV